MTEREGTEREMRGGCEEARRILWPRDRPREYAAGEERAREHVEACARCRDFFRRDEVLVRALRRHGTAARGAPAELRERVYDALARERAILAKESEVPRRRVAGSIRARRWPVIVAAAGLVVTALVAAAIGFGGRGPADEYVQDFASRAVEADAIRTSDPAAVARFFMREMGVSLAPVALEDADLSRAMICLIRGERAAMVEYRWRGHTVAHYRLPLPGPARPAVTGARLRTAEERGVRVVRWDDGRFEHAVVSELPAGELLQLVRSRFLDI